MEKDFFDVFPHLKVKKELEELLDMVFVTKVSMNPGRTHLRVYIESSRWIHKKNIFALEDEIERQCFPGIPMTVTVVEKFHLSEQYTPENFLESYRSSMEMELRNYNMLEYNLFRRSKIIFTGKDTLRMELPDTVISRQKSEILVEYFHKVFCERCGMDLKVELDFVEVKESKYRKNAALQIKQEVENVLKHAKLSGDQESEPKQEDTAREETKKTSGDKSGEKTNEKKSVDKKQQKVQKGDFRGSFGFRRDSNPDVVYGRDFDGETIPLESITGEMGEVIIRCQVMDVEAREIRNEKTILIFPVTDFTDSIVVKMFLRNEQVPEVTESVKKGAFLKLKGVTTIDRFDSELTIGNITGIKKIANFTSTRMDTSPQKRVELHCHTKMSDMDGVSDAKALVKRAYEWGHKAIAITDHGVVQSFPEANHCFDAWGGCVPKESDFKVLYGMEAYLVDDLKGMVTNSRSVGGFKNLTKDVDMNDGLFEVTLIVQPKNPLEMQEIVRNLLNMEDNSDLIYSFKARKLTVEAEEEVAWTLDGEYGGSPRLVEIENMQQALDVLIPLNIRQIHLLPFHQYGEPKYRLLGKTWSMKEVSAPSSADVTTMREMAERAGFQVTVGG